MSQLVQQIDFAESEFALFFAQLDSPEQQKKWIEILGSLLASKGIQTIPISFTGPIQDLLTPIRQSLGERSPLTSVCVVISGLEHSIPPGNSDSPLLSHLNLARELYRRDIQHPTVIWLPESALTTLARVAPDFWAWRSGVFEFDTAIPYLETIQARLGEIEKASRALETLSGILPSDQIEALLASFKDKQQKILAQVRGSGAVAQGEGSIAAGRGSIAIGGDVHGDLYVGPTPTSSPDSLSIYCRIIVQRTSQLALTAIDPVTSDTTVRNRPRLIDVYVNLDTKIYMGNEARENQRDQPLSALDATINNHQLVLLGEPGAGKTTYLNYLAYCLATQFLDDKKIEKRSFPEWPETDTLPILVTLRKFARTLPGRPKAKPESRLLWGFITEELEAQSLSFVPEPLRQALEEGKTLVMLDGLDEVAQEHLKLVGDTVVAFARRYPSNRFLVTSRTLSYSLDWPDLRLPWPVFELAPLDHEKIDRFVNAWHTMMGRLGMVRPEEAQALSRRFQDALQRRDLRSLASNPLLLTVMALVHLSRRQLPESRALLYEETADVLLWRWEKSKAGEDDHQTALRQLLMIADRTDIDLKRLIWQLAFEAQAQASGEHAESAGDVSEAKLLKSLLSLKNNDVRWAQEVADTIRLRSGLLLERAPGIFSFPSRNIQEYFAGAHLTAQADFVANCTEILKQDWYLWREVVLLAAERLAFLVGDTSRPLALVGELCPSRIAYDELSWRNVWLAGNILLQVGIKRLESYALGSDLIARVRQRLVELLTRGELSPVERASAGDTLGKLGDPRIDLFFASDEQDLRLVEVPAGPFIMGSHHHGEEAWSNEKPAHQVTLPSYYIAHYPVTVAQFFAFVEDSGYQPADPESLAGIPNHPVVLVTWDDALAYCDWLTNKLRSHENDSKSSGSILREGWIVTLPSEAEWEKAARGEDGRTYPWGDEFDSNRANTSETGIGSPTTVGIFPGGASPYGVLDMVGNVWEWTRSSWGRAFETPDYSYPYRSDDGREDLKASREIYRILRGGSFYENRRFARTTFRMSNNPALWRANIGFRVVVSPVAFE